MEGAARVEAHRAGRGLALLLAFWFLSCSACDTDAYNSPEPSSLEHHQHTVILRFRTINHEADTVGVASASADFGAILTRRDAGGRLTRTEASLGDHGLSIQFLFPDTEAHACTVEATHFVGYQQKYGGDTTRYGMMDPYGEWEVRFMPLTFSAIGDSGETLSVGRMDMRDMPDSVRADGLWELDLTLDMDGLFSWNQTYPGLVFHTDRVVVRQR